MNDRIIIADASKVSGAQFLEHFFGSYEAKRQEQFERCIRAINRGDTYGWPPMMVEHCKKLMAEREALTEVVRDIDPQSGNERAAA